MPRSCSLLILWPRHVYSNVSYGTEHFLWDKNVFVTIFCQFISALKTKYKIKYRAAEEQSEVSLSECPG